MPPSISELIERKHRLETENVAFEKEIAKRQTEIATIDRTLEKEALRLAGAEAKKNEKGKEVKDLIGTYKGQAKRILTAIWNAPKHRLIITKICKIEWQDEVVQDTTFTQAIKRINRQLRKDECGYILKPIKSRKYKEIKGYGVRRDRGQKGQK
jgi:Skp family chaperone for outer membrane proteins